MVSLCIETTMNCTGTADMAGDPGISWWKVDKLRALGAWFR